MQNQSSSSSSSSSPSMQFLLLEQVQFVHVNDDSLLQWELVDVVSEEEEEEEEEREEEGSGSWDSPVSWSGSVPIDAPIEGLRHLILRPDVDPDVEDAGDDDDGDDDGDDEYGLDDELVPWNVGNKLGRQRMRKLGKRAFSKMQNSKRSPYLFVRPGCLRGKHGLGLKHNY